jgi:DNA-binding transcriptional LysR family regulator
MIGCAAAGMGIALVPLSLLAAIGATTSVSTHRLPAEFAHAPTQLVARRDQRSPATDALRALLLAENR